MKSIIFISLALSVFDQPPHQNDKNWLNYKEKFQKKYMNKQEEIIRYKNFLLKDEMINNHNEKYSMGLSTYKMGHNQFSDMTNDEVRELYLHQKETYNFDFPRIVSNFTQQDLPCKISYQKYCLPPLNQGDCGSCWAFAAAAEVEVQLKRRNFNYNTYISPQYILDCSQAGSCNGGRSEFALDFLKRNGLVSLSNYKYIGKDDACKANSKLMKEKISNVYKRNIGGNENELAFYLVNQGPVVVYTFVSENFYHYAEGVFSDNSCPNNCFKTTHAMLAVGYGSKKEDYWLIKNSWGDKWGESGYVKMRRNYRNNCNVACFISYVTVN